MPRSTTPSEGREIRNRDRIKRIVLDAIDREIVDVRQEIDRYVIAAGKIGPLVGAEQIEYLKTVVAGLQRARSRFQPNRSRHIPQEQREKSDG